MAIDIVARALAVKAGTIVLSYDKINKQMSFTDAQGNVIIVPLEDFIKDYTGMASTDIKTTIEAGNVIKATLIDSSIDMVKLSLTLQNIINGKLDTTSYLLDKKVLEDNILKNGNYLNIINKPKINGIEVSGDKTSDDYKLTGDKSFVYDQQVPSSVWDITHNLSKFCDITIVDSAGNIVIGDVSYINNNEIKVSFSENFSGKAYLN